MIKVYINSFFSKLRFHLNAHNIHLIFFFSGHGTHTMGIMISTSPSSKWITCRAFINGINTPGSIESCLQFFAEPTKVDGTSPDGLRRPQLISNSYGVQSTVSLLRAYSVLDHLGIFQAAALGNSGTCGGVLAYPAMLPFVFALGATLYKSDLVANFSSRGSVSNFPIIKPDSVVPGDRINSTWNNGGYHILSGTSMSSPLLAGAAALLMSVESLQFLKFNSISLSYLFKKYLNCVANDSCGKTSKPCPNYVYGYGLLDMESLYMGVITNGTIFCGGIPAGLSGHVCNGAGNCTSPDNCICHRGYFGVNCEKVVSCFSKNFNDSSVCSGRGICNSTDNCLCYNSTSHVGKNCEISILPPSEPSSPNNQTKSQPRFVISGGNSSMHEIMSCFKFSLLLFVNLLIDIRRYQRY